MQARLKHTIAGRLYLVGGLAITAILALAGVAIYFAASTGRAAEHLYGGSLVSAVEASEIEVLLERHRRLIEGTPLELDRTQIARDIDAAENLTQRIDKLIGRAAPALVDRVKAELPRLWQLGAEVMQLADSFAQEQAQSVVARYAETADRVQAAIRAYRGEHVEAAESEATQLVASARRLMQWVVGFALVAALLIGPLAFFLLRSMVLRIDRITASMRRLAANDTAVPIRGLEDGDEVGEMARAVAVFRDNAVKLLDHRGRLEQVNRWLDVALNNMTRGLSMFDAERRLVVCNAAYTRLYALPRELTLPGTPFSDIIEHRRQLVREVDRDGASPEPRVGTALEAIVGDAIEAKFGQRLHDGRIIEVSVKPLEWGGWVAIHEDVTERRQAADKIARLARQDTLTGLANRHQFHQQLDQAAATVTSLTSFALLAIDLDRFKEVNDTLGHPVGDALLVEVGQRLVGVVRNEDVVGRLGGDEFAVIQSGVASRSDAEALARRIIEVLHQPFHIHGQRISIGGTIGIALSPLDGETAGDLLRHADLALYRAKGEQRGTLCFFDHAMEARLRERRLLEADLAVAVERRQLELHFQPIVALREGRVSGCEALVRWRHPVRGMVSPAEFIPLAEETGLIAGIGAWVLGEACRAAASWPEEVRVAVNLSVAQFGGPDIGQIAVRALAESGLAAGRLELEVTESILLGHDPATLAMLHRLHAQGISIALDDFGTGYSSLSHLRSFPFDKIKIDQSFVRDLPQRRNCEAIVGAVARLAVSLDMTTVAEGVETLDHLDRVQAAGCDEVQGYLFSRPVPGADIVRVIAEIDAKLPSARAA